MMSPLFSGQHFVLKGVSPSSPTTYASSLLGPVERVHIPLSVAVSSAAASIEPAYDTGASVSVLSQGDFNRIKHDTYVKPIRNWSCSVSAANGSLLRLNGAYLVRLFFEEKSYLFAFLVSPDVTTSLFGLNLSCHYGMSFDAINRCIYIPRSDTIKEPSHDGKPFARAILAKETSVDALTGRKVNLFLQDLDGKRLEGCREGILDAGKVACRFDTDAYSRMIIHLPNPHRTQTVFPKGHVVGEVFSLADWRPIYDAREAASTAAAVEAADAPVRKVRPHTPEEKKRIIELITKQVNLSVPYQYRQEYIDMLSAREHAFSADDFDLGQSRDFQHEIHFKGTDPCYTPQFRLSDEHLDFLKNSVLGWLKAGIIQRTRSLHNSPIFCVNKKAVGPDGRFKLRPVLDYRRVNSRSMDDRYSILTIDDCLNAIGKSGSRVFSTLDFRNSYWQLNLRKKDSPLTAFTLPGIGQFAYTGSCPQGLLGAPASYSRLMQRIMADAESILTYLDDTLVYTVDHAKHIPALKIAIDRIINSNLLLNPEKCVFGARSVPYLGVQLTENGIAPGADKVAVLADMAPPTTLKALKSVCGLFNWFRKFIYQYARKVQPLHRLTKPENGYKEGQLPADALAAFYLLRREITSRPVLAYPNSYGKYHLYVDAALGDAKNTGGYGATLMQEQRDGSRRPIAFASRLLSGAEKNYPTTLSEWNGCVFGMTSFSFHLRGRRFCLHTDHKPLARPFEDLSDKHVKTLHRLNYNAVDFHPEMCFIEGKANSAADFLSRYFGYNVAPDVPVDKLRINANVAYVTHRHGSLDSLDVSPSRVSLLQANDPYIKELISALSSKPAGVVEKIPECPHPITISNGLLYVKTPPRDTFLDDPAKLRIVAPEAMKREIMSAAHQSLIGGHSGSFRVAERIRDTFWWPNMERDVNEHLRACAACRTATNKYPDPTAPLKSIPIPTSIGQVYYSDLFGPLTDLKGNKNTYVMTVTDAFSKFVRLYKLDAKDAVTVSHALYRDFSVWGPPRQCVTDGGKEYRNSVQRNLMQLFGTTHTFTSIYHPETDGMSEIFNKTLRHFLATALLDAEKSGTSYELFLPALAHSYNSSVSQATHVSPFTTHFGTKMRVPLWPLLKDEMILDPALSKSGSFTEYVTQLRRAQHVARQLAHDMAERSHDRNTRQYNKSNDVAYKFYSKGDRVLVRRNDRQTLKNQKLAANFEPAIILRQVDDSTYLVRRYLRRHSRNVLVHSKLIKELPPGRPIVHNFSSSSESGSDSEREERGESRALLPPPPRLPEERLPPPTRAPSLPLGDNNSFQEGVGQSNESQAVGHGQSGLPGQSHPSPPLRPPSNQELHTDRRTPPPPVSERTHTQTVRPTPLNSQPADDRRPEQSRVYPSQPKRSGGRGKRRRPSSPSIPPSSVDLGEEPDSPSSVQVSDANSNGRSRISRQKFSQTSNDPLLQNLPPYSLPHQHPPDECYSSASRDSDGLPHAVSDSDVDLLSLSSDGRRKRVARKRSLEQGQAHRRKFRRMDKGEKRPAPKDAPENDRKRTRSGLLYFLSGLKRLPARKRKKLIRDYAGKDAHLLNEILGEYGEVSSLAARDDMPSLPNAIPLPRADSHPPKIPPLLTSDAPAGATVPPSLFEADRSALRALLRSTT